MKQLCVWMSGKEVCTPQSKGKTFDAFILCAELHAAESFKSTFWRKSK